MDRLARRAMALAAVVLAALLSMGAPAQSGGEGLLGTPHDFTSTGSGDVKGPPGTGPCIFCHTPAVTSGAHLMWNHAVTPNTFRWGAASTFGGTPLPTNISGAYSGTSARCLSCHDGSVAIGHVVVADPALSAGSTMLSSSRMADFATRYQIGAGGSLVGDHPVGVPYPLGRIPNHYNGITNGQGRGTFAANEWQVDPTASSAAHIRLYADDGAGSFSVLSAGALATNAGIECSSCHDPHNRASVDVLFLRGKLGGRSRADGFLCEQCHSKLTR